MPRPLNVRQLEAFRAVMLSGSMTGAGKLLSISQPAVTRLIRELEADLNLTLFHREGTQLLFTDEGRKFYREVERHFISTERIREAAAAIREYNAGQLRIATILALSVSCIPQAVTTFAASYPGIVTSVRSGPSLDIIDLVVNGSVDVGFVAIPPGRKDLNYQAIPESEVVCLLPRTHPLAGRDVIDASDLHDQDFIALDPSSLMRLELNAILHLAGAVPRIRVESLFSSTVVAYVNRGLGIAIVDPLAVSLVDPEKTVVRAFRPRIKYVLSIVYPPRVDRSTLVEDFVNFFLKAFGDEMQAARALMPDAAK
jgi:DNA-binding transcriptional LysR family regulator